MRTANDLLLSNSILKLEAMSIKFEQSDNADLWEIVYEIDKVVHLMRQVKDRND